MIDTEKYEGHTEGPWIPQVNSQVSTAVHANAVHYVPTRAVTIIATVEYNHPQNKALIADAPLLLAEVKRLRSIADDLYAYIVSDADISLSAIEEQMDWREEGDE